MILRRRTRFFARNPASEIMKDTRLILAPNA
jgi:hypothetical protein